MSRKEEGIELTNIEDYVDTTIWGLKEYAKNSKKRLITVVSNSNNNRNISSVDY